MESSPRERLDRLRVACLTILWHPDSGRVGERVALPALRSRGSVLLSRGEPRFASAAGGRPRGLGDLQVSRTPLHLVGQPDGGLLLVRGELKTEVLVDGETLEEERFLGAEELSRGIALLIAGRVALLVHTLDIQPPPGGSDLGLVGSSAAMIQLRRQIRQVADSRVSVLLTGETGTGKELAAKAIHECSRRSDGPLVAVNLAAVPAALAAAELFGAERGAFTGADRKRVGFFHQAAGGTLFLDEVGDTPMDVQVLLLRALENREVQPVGAARPEASDVRVIAATDADLELAIKEGRFRAPLLHRLNGFSLHLPPLRRRLDDLGLLLVHFLRRELRGLGEDGRLDPAGPRDRPWLSASTVMLLARYRWPGNIRELANVCRKLAIAGRGEREVRLGAAGLDHLAVGAGRSATSEEPAGVVNSPDSPPVYRPTHEVSEDELVEALRSNRWRLLPTAKQLGVSRTSLYALIDRSPKVRRASDLSVEEIEESRARNAGHLDRMAEELEVSRQALQWRLRQLHLG